LGGAKRGFGGKTLGLKAVLFAAIFFFRTLDEGLALGVGGLTQGFEALALGLIGGLQALAKHGKEVRAARSQQTNANVSDTLTIFASNLVLDALAQHVKESVGRRSLCGRLHGRSRSFGWRDSRGGRLGNGSSATTSSFLLSKLEGGGRVLGDGRSYRLGDRRLRRASATIATTEEEVVEASVFIEKKARRPSGIAEGAAQHLRVGFGHVRALS
jgi:hypothetical protein